MVRAHAPPPLHEIKCLLWSGTNDHLGFLFFLYMRRTQVSFQLQLHKHEDVHERAEVTLTRQKSRRRAKASSNAAGHQHHSRHGGAPGTNPSFSRTMTAGSAVARTVSRATAAENVTGSKTNPVEDATIPRGHSHDSGSGLGGKGIGSAMPAGSTDTSPKDDTGGARPAVPVDPPSSSATTGRYFRRTNTGARARGGGDGG